MALNYKWHQFNIYINIYTLLLFPFSPKQNCILYAFHFAENAQEVDILINPENFQTKSQPEPKLQDLEQLGISQKAKKFMETMLKTLMLKSFIISSTIPKRIFHMNQWINFPKDRLQIRHGTIWGLVFWQLQISKNQPRISMIDWLIVFWFYAVSTTFQPCNGGDY